MNFCDQGFDRIHSLGDFIVEKKEFFKFRGALLNLIGSLC